VFSSSERSEEGAVVSFQVQTCPTPSDYHPELTTFQAATKSSLHPSGFENILPIEQIPKTPTGITLKERK